MKNNNSDDRIIADQVSLNKVHAAADTASQGTSARDEGIDGVCLHVSRTTLVGFYYCLVAGNLLLILMTLLSDLGFAFTKHRVLVQFDLKQEGNIAVWYSSTILLLAGLAAFIISSRPLATPSWWLKYLWRLVALFFVAMSADEAAQLHEEAGVVFTKYFGVVSGLTEGSLPVFGWLLALLPAMLVFLSLLTVAALSCFRFHLRSRRLLVGGVACLVGAGIAEYVQAQMVRLSMDRFIQGVIEEGLELSGITLFLFAFLEYLRTQSKHEQ